MSVLERRSPGWRPASRSRSFSAASLTTRSTGPGSLAHTLQTYADFRRSLLLSAESHDVGAYRLLGLRVDSELGRGEVPVRPQVLNMSGTLCGGVGLAAAIALGERTLGRDVLWASVQYISPIRAGERLVLEVEAGRRGRVLTQAVVRGTVDGRPALLATGTFGDATAETPRDEAAASLGDGPCSQT